MENGRLQIILTIITAVSGWGLAIITNWGVMFNSASAADQNSVSSIVEVQKDEYEKLKAMLQQTKSKLSDTEQALTNTEKTLTDSQAQVSLLEDDIKQLKIPFHQISNTKLKQLLKFHNAAVCYGRSLNLTHPAGEDYQHCESKEKLAKKLLMFFEELELIDGNTSNYSSERAKDALIHLQTHYQFNNPGWYSDIMLGILIIEYAKKA